jgi:hypothetical protein
MQRLLSTNWIAIVVSVIAHFIVGATWYGVFAEPWMNAIGKKMEDFAGQTPLIYLIALVSATVLTLTTIKAMDLANERTIAGGVKWAVLLWLCLSFMYGWVHNAFSGYPFTLTLIDAGQELVAAVLTGVIVGALGFRGARATSPAISTAPAAA